MCKECDATKSTLPSVEHFQQRYKNPRVYFLFYNYFLRAVMGENKWKSNIKENKKLATNIAEAYAHSLLENNYFAWLFEYKAKKIGADIKTEYDAESGDDESDDEWPDSLYMPEELRSIEISAPDGDDDEFNLVAEADDEERHRELKAKRREIHEETERAARSRDSGHLRQYEEMNHACDGYSSDARMLDQRQATTKRRKLMKTLKVHSSSKGGSDASNKFIFDMTAQVKEDHASGKQKKFEKAYRKMLKAIEVSNEEEQRSIKRKYKVDCDVLYGAEEEEV